MSESKSKLLRSSILIFVIVFSLLAILCFRPIKESKPENCKNIRGLVTEVRQAGTRDLVIQLQDSKHEYYINRALERGLVLKTVRYELKDNEVLIDYVKHWTPLDIFGTSKHIAQLKLGDRIVYSEYFLGKK